MSPLSQTLQSKAAQYVMRRYRVSPHTAEVIATLAGLGSESSR
jgi:hypothetical protein